jgi:decaprenylphospho-beta-D-ribofuranose 2-oxidase
MRDAALLTSFDSTHSLRTRVSRPETYRHLNDAVATNDVVIARGAGLSYCPASFGADALSIDVTRFDRMLAYDASSGEVEVEPGLSIGALVGFLAARGRYLPALPGYPSITVGGCMAFDVHGKSQFHSGNFADWVVDFDLAHRDLTEQACDAKPAFSHSDIRRR